MRMRMEKKQRAMKMTNHGSAGKYRRWITESNKCYMGFYATEVVESATTVTCGKYQCQGLVEVITFGHEIHNSIKGCIIG